MSHLLRQSPSNPYDSELGYVKDLTSDMIDSIDGCEAEPHVIYRVEGTNPFADIARSVESEVFREKFGNSPKTMLDNYAPYDSDSEFYISVDVRKKLAFGALRVTHKSEAGSKTLNDLSTVNGISSESMLEYHGISNDDDYVDVDTVAVMPEYRRKLMGWAGVKLYKAMYSTAHKQSINHMLAIIDKAPFVQLTDVLHIPLKPLKDMGPIKYLNSPASQPVYGYLPDFHPHMHERIASLNIKGMQLEFIKDLLELEDPSFKFNVVPL